MSLFYTDQFTDQQIVTLCAVVTYLTVFPLLLVCAGFAGYLHHRRIKPAPALLPADWLHLAPEFVPGNTGKKAAAGPTVVRKQPEPATEERGMIGQPA